MTKFTTNYGMTFEEVEEALRISGLFPQSEKSKFLEKCKELDEKYPGIIRKEMLDYVDILAKAAESGKYSMDNWLQPNGKTCAHKEIYGSIFRHVGESYSYIKKDRDSGQDPRLHAMCRLMMDYIRDKRGLKHEQD